MKMASCKLARIGCLILAVAAATVNAHAASAQPNASGRQRGASSDGGAGTSSRVTAAPTPMVGVMYEGWHGPAWAGLKNRSTALTLEDVIRSNGRTTLADMQAGINLSTAMSFHFHKEPEGGFYCIYRKRSNETSGLLPQDCVNITQTLARHAAMLVSAGVDFIAVDSTNMQHTGPGGDVLQLRPFEVLLEEWAALREAGFPTPQVAIWQNLQDPTGDLWRVYTDTIYNNPAYSDLIYRDAFTKKQVFFSTGSPNPGLVDQIQSRGMAVVVMWALHQNYDKGEWSFFSPCRDPVTGDFTTSIPPQSDRSIKCGQSVTTNSTIGARGTSMTVSPSYQLSYSALPFRASGKLGGLTLKQQFATVFSKQASLDYLMVGTFNEHVAQPQHNPFYPPNTAAIAMGLEEDPGRYSLWVDLYGDGITRDLEPTVQDGGSIWALFLSCTRVLRGGVGCTGKAATNESCCDFTAAESSWTPVYSLNATKADGQYLLTTNGDEATTLQKQGWAQFCPPFGGGGAFCAYEEHVQVTPAMYALSPFLIRKVGTTGKTVGLTRCLSTKKFAEHFYSTDRACHGVGKPESLLGYAMLARSSEAPRSLRQCGNAPTFGATTHFHTSLDAPCPEYQLEALGYVH